MSRPVIARLRTQALTHNYQLLCQQAGEASVMAVIKANGYGHGLEGVATRLWDAGCRHFAVTDAEEGAALRQILLAQDSESGDAEIALLAGLFDDGDAQLVCKHQLTPVIHDKEEVARLLRARFSGRLWLKMDTGMHRLGAEAARQLLDRCYRRRWPVIGLMSHLACSDDANHPLNTQQIERLRSFLNLLGPGLKGSQLSSAGLATMPEAALDVVRPGIALYGSEPVVDQPLGLKPVMQLEAEVMQVRKVAAGESISYGADFVADRPMRVAVLCAGYGDGIPRLLGARGGQVVMHEVAMPIVGRVCMDYTMVDVTGHPVRAGDRAQFWGDDLPANAVAARCDTISYELFTGVGSRGQRIWE